MVLSEVTFDGARPIDSYGPGFFRIGGEVVRGAVVLGPGSLRGWSGWQDTGFDASEIDVLLIGTGTETAHPPAGFRAAVEALGIGVEPMATPAACRTYNVLVSEGRRVAVAMFPVATVP